MDFVFFHEKLILLLITESREITHFATATTKKIAAKKMAVSAPVAKTNYELRLLRGKTIGNVYFKIQHFQHFAAFCGILRHFAELGC